MRQKIYGIDSILVTGYVFSWLVLVNYIIKFHDQLFFLFCQHPKNDHC